MNGRHAARPADDWRRRGTSLWRAQQGLDRRVYPSGPPDDTLAFFALRDEAGGSRFFAAARAQRLVDQGVSPMRSVFWCRMRRAMYAAFVAPLMPLAFGFPGLPCS